ncbi:RHS repeat-associated core domain-containing protein [Microbacterium sp. H83]|uniref:RHS repeat-associated core domain-containing protein n=1 Tax=Microbacterium sp. H83 TaxID=1827324 RepID=UPI0012FC5B8F|nr:RHS repeat-associated core domain-containing protein [Microbacterium sp. H83]
MSESSRASADPRVRVRLSMKSVGLPGGVSWTNQAGAVTWSFPDLSGHGLITRSGGTNSALLLWDPFGQPVDPVTFALGTASADDTGQVAGNTLWHQGALKPAESAGSTLVVEMGARLYVPAFGRFLQVDPIEGGVDNDYVWPPDPINQHDLSGKAVPLIALAAALVRLVVSLVSGTSTLVLARSIKSRPIPKTPPAQRTTRLTTTNGVTVPIPQPTWFRKDKSYMVYEIFNTRTNETWKYGITSAEPVGARPQAQISTCEAKSNGDRCDWISLQENVAGYYNARLWEDSYIAAYVGFHGVCPPGQVTSCK